MKNTKLNIDNLTQLWKIAGQAFDNYFENETYCYSIIENSKWPNRIWTNKTLAQETIQEIKLKMKKIDGLTLSHFSESNKDNPLLTDSFFAIKSTQYGMSLLLTEKFKTRKTLDFREVTDKADADLWSTAFYQSFKYKISTETVLKTKNDIQYFLLFHEQQLLGTVVLLITDKVLGIHSLGIVPSQRKSGFAIEIMHQALNLAIDQDLTLATLQASEMAKKMYLKMGFSLDFLMQNFQIKH